MLSLGCLPCPPSSLGDKPPRLRVRAISSVSSLNTCSEVVQVGLMSMLLRYSLISSFPIRGQSPLLPTSSIAQQSCHSPGQEGVDVVRGCWIWAQGRRDHKCRSLGPVLAPVVCPIGPKTGRDRLTKHHIAWKGGHKGC